MNILLKFGGEANQNITTAKVGGFLRIIKEFSGEVTYTIKEEYFSLKFVIKEKKFLCIRMLRLSDLIINLL